MSGVMAGWLTAGWTVTRVSASMGSCLQRAASCLMSSSWRILILSLSIWILWSRSFCCCCCWVVNALGMLMSPAGGFWVGWFCWLRVVDAICCWCWWFITRFGWDTAMDLWGAGVGVAAGWRFIGFRDWFIAFLGSCHVVIFSMWLRKYLWPVAVKVISQPGGSGSSSVTS